MKYVCQVCKILFIHNGNPKLYCSKTCKYKKHYEIRSSKRYINNKLELKLCKQCNKTFKPKLAEQVFCNRICANRFIAQNRIKSNTGDKRTYLIPIKCKFCKELFKPKHAITKFCSVKCAHKHSRSPENYEERRRIGSKGGKISARNQVRRSKNEIYFYELCLKLFPKAINNEPIFDGWDADVILPQLKIAVLWNGIWHYQKIAKAHNLEQVQRRDRIKLKIINKYNYKAYIIKDMGKHDKKFVESEFEKFKNYVYFI